MWTEQFEETEPLATPSPEGLAQALSTVMARIVARATPEIAGITGRQAELAERPKRSPGSSN